MFFQYYPLKKIAIDQVELEFGESRSSVRNKLVVDYRDDNAIIDLGDDVPPIIRRRDVYDNTNSSGVYFFLNYDENDCLRDIEIHQCDKIQIFDVVFNFESHLNLVAAALRKYSENTKEDEGEYTFVDLRMVIMSRNKIGGEGNTVGYLYCSSDIAHLAEAGNAVDV